MHHLINLSVNCFFFNLIGYGVGWVHIFTGGGWGGLAL